MGRQRSTTATRLIRGFLALAVGVIGTPIVLVASMASPATAMPTNAIAEFPVTPTDAGPLGITAGPDGNMWFTQLNSNGDPSADDIGKITSSGVITEYQIPTANSGAWGIASGGDGNLYFTELAANNIAQITTSGVITEFAIPTLTAHPTAITAGPDGNL